MKTFAHVSTWDDEWPAADLYVVHGTNGTTRNGPRSIPQPQIRYAQAAGEHEEALGPRKATPWAKSCVDLGWDGAYLDVMDWRTASDKKIANSIATVLPPAMPLISNGFPFHIPNLDKQQSYVNACLKVCEGFQFEGPYPGQAEKVLVKYPNTVILWLVFGDIDDTQYRNEFEAHATDKHFYGRRIYKSDGTPQEPR